MEDNDIDVADGTVELAEYDATVYYKDGTKDEVSCHRVETEGITIKFVVLVGVEGAQVAPHGTDGLMFRWRPDRVVNMQEVSEVDFEVAETQTFHPADFEDETGSVVPHFGDGGGPKS